MKKLIAGLFVLSIFFTGGAFAADEKFLSCGEGYLVISKGKVDGIEQYECQKLWCRDLENGKVMGAGDRANAGYRVTSTPFPGVEDSKGNQIACFGDRKWCSNEDTGVWNPEYGAYTKRGADSNAYLSAQKGDCFAWLMQKPICTGEGEAAVLEGGEWVCVVSEQSSDAVRKSTIRRTGTIRRR